MVNLDEISVSYPCPADWNAMEGDERVRFCCQCKLNVYNISEMTQDAARELIAEKEGEERLCIRLYRRPDGTVITDNCPVGLRKFRARVRANFMALIIWVFGIAFVSWVVVHLQGQRFSIISGGMGMPAPLPMKTGIWVLVSSFVTTQIALTAVSLKEGWREQWMSATAITFLAGLAFGGLSGFGPIADPIYFIVFMLPCGVFFAAGSLLTAMLVLNRSHFPLLEDYFQFRQRLAPFSLPTSK